jgi:hypothetical protein
MKFITNTFRNVESDQWGRFVFMDESTDDTTTSSNPETRSQTTETVEQREERTIDEILKDPLAFSIKSLRVLEQANLDNKQKAKFRDIMNYYISLSTTKVDFAPPRILSWVDASPKLRKILGTEMRQILSTVLLTERKNLQNILSKDVWQWTDFQLMRVCSLYNILKKKRRNNKIDQVFVEAKNKILERGKMFLVRSGIDPHDRVNDIVSFQKGEEKRPLTPTEKLLLLEIRALFPNSSDWGTEVLSLHWKKLTQDTVKGLLGSDEREKQKPRYSLAWEIIDLLRENLEGGEGGEDLRESFATHAEEIKKFIRHGNKVQLLAFAEKQPVLSHIHQKSLQAIKTEEETARTTYDWKEEKPLIDKEQEKLRKEITKLKFRLEGLEKVALEDARKKAAETESTPEAKEDIEKFVDAETQKQGKQENVKRHLEGLGDFITEFESKIPEFATIETGGEPDEYLKTEFTNIKDSLVTQNEEYETLKNNEEITPEEKTIKESRLFEEIKNNISRFEGFRNEKEKKLSYFKIFTTEYNEYVTAQDKYEKAFEVVKNTFTFSEEYKEQIKKLEEERRTLEQDWIKRVKENSRYNRFAEFYQDIQGKAEEISKNFWEGLQKRIKLHQLRAADYELLFKIENASADKKAELGVPSGFEIPRKLVDFRQRFQQVLNTRIEKVISSRRLEQDSYEEWYKAIYEEFTYAALKEALGGEFGISLDQYRIDGKLVMPPEEITILLEGAIRHFKEDIIDQLKNKFEGTEEEKEDQSERFFVELESLYRSAETEEDLLSLQTAQDHYLAGSEHTKHLLEVGKKTLAVHLNDIASIDVRELNEQYDLGLSSTEQGSVQQKLEQLVTRVLNPEGAGYLKKKKENPEDLDGIEELLDIVLEELEEGEIKENLKTALSERLLFEQTFPVRVEWAQEGHVITDPGTEEEVYLPGRTQLNNLGLQTLRISNRTETTTQFLQDTLQVLHSEMVGVSTGREDIDPKIVKEEITESLGEFVNDWETRMKYKLLGEVSLMRDIAEDIFGVNAQSPDSPKKAFLENYFEKILKVVDDVDTLFKQLKEPGRLEQESHILDIRERLDGLRNLMNVRSGILAEEKTRASESDLGGTIQITDENGSNRDIEVGPNAGLANVKKYGYFEGKETFETNFKRVRNDFNEKFRIYQENVDKVIEIIERDIRKNTENAFHEKYGMDPTQALNVIAQHQEQKNEFSFVWGERLGNEEYFQGWLSRLGSENPEQKNQALIEFGNLEGIAEVAKACGSQATGIKEWLADYESKKKTNRRGKRKEFSLYDIYLTFKTSIEAANKHWKRNSDRNVAQIGSGFWGKNNRFGKEFHRMQEESETARMKEFQTQYHDSPGWEIWAAVGRSNNPDEVRACINLLSQKGYLKWDDPLLWRALNKLQRTVQFNLDEDMSLTPYQIREKVSQAASIIWTTEIFDDWDKSLEGNLKKAQDGYAEDFRKYENDGSARFDILAGMLQRWGRGESAQCDPARFAGFLKQAFIKGKMNGNPDGRFYFLIQGMTLRNPSTGQTLLSRDVLNSFGDEFVVRFPHVEFFSDKGSPKYKGRIVPEDFPGAEKRDWKQSDFEEWAKFMGSAGGSFNPRNAEPTVERFFFHYIHMSEFARDRVQRMQRFADKEGDHDDAWAFFLEWDQRQLVTQLGQRSEGTEKNSPDFWRTFISSFPNYMKMMNEYIENGDKEFGGTPGWRKEKERILMEVGGRLKVGMTLMQALLGNFTSYHARPMIFGKDRWEKGETRYSFAMLENKEKVNKFARIMFNQSGNEELKRKYEKILDFKGYDHGATGEQLKDLAKKDSTSEYAMMNSLSEELMTKEDVNVTLFGDTTAIEQALKQYARTV